MAFSVLAQEQSDVLQGGQVVLQCQFQTFPGSGAGAPATSVSIGITASSGPGQGSGTPVPAGTTTGLQGIGASLFSFTWSPPATQATGDYVVTWTGTVNGTVQTYVQTVTVAAVGSGSPSPGVYATAGQYRAWSGDDYTPDQLVNVKLMRATEDLDGHLVGAVYPTNANGMPTDPFVIDVFMRACCAQCQWLLAENDDAGVKRQYTSTSVGGVSQARVAAATGMGLPPLAPRAWQILRTAGALSISPLLGI